MSLHRIVSFSTAVLCAWAASPATPAFAQTRVEAEGLCRMAVTRKFGSEYTFDQTDATLGRDGSYDVTGQARNGRGERLEFSCNLEGRRVKDASLRFEGGGGPGRDREVVCESRNRNRNDCRMDTRGGVRLIEQTSDTRCREGSNWGYDRDSVWVDRGCSGRFESKAGGRGRLERLGDACERAVAEAERIAPRAVKAEETPRRLSQGVFEFDLRTPRGPFVCTIERDGDVRTIRRR
ncbi:MAG: DUF3011 domain-containing protein [Caldimonas sp.]